jgi:hypothetical protein
MLLTLIPSAEIVADLSRDDTLYSNLMQKVLQLLTRSAEKNNEVTIELVTLFVTILVHTLIDPPIPHYLTLTSFTGPTGQSWL